jgi:Na+-translocating ferredoxin:NAD+ oxidoreductase RnfG subunit
MHLRYLRLHLSLVGLLWLLLPGAAQAHTLLTTDQALKEMLPDADEIVQQTCVLSRAEAGNILEHLRKHNIQFPSKDKVAEAQKLEEYTFYFGVKNGSKTGVAIIEDQPGEWGNVKLIVALNPVSGRVVNCAVMAFTERRGAPIAERYFMRQFVGKGQNDPVNIGEDINVVTGATISSQAACYGINKMVDIYAELFLNYK